MTAVAHLIDGPMGGEHRAISDQEQAQGFLTVFIQTRPPASATPVFDAALGLPTPEPAKGIYRPRPGHDPSYWYWTPNPPTRRKF